jgi:hypothetical protein
VGPGNYEHVGKSQSALITIDPIISPPHPHVIARRHVQVWGCEVLSRLGGGAVAAITAAGGVQVSPKRLLDESPWLQFTSECQRF